MAEPVRARQLSDEEGRRLLQIVRRGRKRPVRLPPTYHRTHGVRYFHGCCSVGGPLGGDGNRM